MIQGTKYWAVAKVNFRRGAFAAYLAAGICLLAGISDLLLDQILQTGDITISPYNFVYLVTLLAPVLFASVSYTKFMHIGVKKKTYLYGCALNYVVYAAIASLLGVLETYLIDRPLSGPDQIYGLVSVFGWDQNVLTAFFCPFAFLLFVEAVLHTLTFIQTKWYGWAADLLIVVILSVFTPIAPLRQAEVWFFNLIIFQKPAILQIGTCLLLSLLVYASNLFYLRRRGVN